MREKSHSGENMDRGTIQLWNGFIFHVRGFGCVQHQVLSTYGKNAQSTGKVVQKWTIQSEIYQKSSHCNSRALCLEIKASTNKT